MDEHLLQTIGVLVIVALVVFSRMIRSLLTHQQKMTQILQEARNHPQTDERVLRELAELRNLMVGQALAIDNLRSEKSLPPTVDSVQNRLNV
jgi:uncharacterized protein YutE (UPF0331/DUF86 family)